MWLLNQLFTHGDQPAPRFAFQGTVNWMRGLAILSENGFSHVELRNFYQTIQRRQPNHEADALAYEYITMSMHNVSAIDSMESIENPYPIVRSAIVAWYYAVFYASKAMLAASSGSDPQQHAAAGKAWQAEIIDSRLVKLPFSLSISNLTPSNVKQVINELRNGNEYNVTVEPETYEMALGAMYSYLNGTAEYEKLRLEEHVRSSKDFKDGGYTNFKTNAAKALRDAKLRPAHVNFLVQAFRYRGKANYRDAIYLSYGRNDTDTLKQFISDLGQVAGVFSLMAAHFVSKRVISADWNSFAEDITQHAQFELPYDPREI